MTQIEIDEDCQRFLVELFKKTQGNTQVNVSMFDVGAELGMDKTLSSRTAEVLIGWELTEVRTLSGAIGITAEGIEEARKLGAVGSEAGIGVRKLDNSVSVMDNAACLMIEKIVNELKFQTAKLELNFDTLNELIADLKTIDAQMNSPKPKTAIIRACFSSVKDILEKTKATDTLSKLRSLLG